MESLLQKCTIVNLSNKRKISQEISRKKSSMMITRKSSNFFINCKTTLEQLEFQELSLHLYKRVVKGAEKEAGITIKNKLFEQNEKILSLLKRKHSAEKSDEKG